MYYPRGGNYILIYITAENGASVMLKEPTFNTASDTQHPPSTPTILFPKIPASSQRALTGSIFSNSIHFPMWSGQYPILWWPLSWSPPFLTPPPTSIIASPLDPYTRIPIIRHHHEGELTKRWIGCGMQSHQEMEARDWACCWWCCLVCDP